MVGRMLEMSQHRVTLYWLSMKFLRLGSREWALLGMRLVVSMGVVAQAHDGKVMSDFVPSHTHIQPNAKVICEIDFLASRVYEASLVQRMGANGDKTWDDDLQGLC